MSCRANYKQMNMTATAAALVCVSYKNAMDFLKQVGLFANSEKS